MNENAQTICDRNAEAGCHAICPLSDACNPQYLDTHTLWVDRVNAAADKLEE